MHRLALARRLERAEASACAAYVDARRAVEPGAGAEWIEVAGAYAMFDGVGSPLTQSFGIGIFEPFLEAELGRVEAFFGERGSGAFHEVCELADSRSATLIEQRGYNRIEESIVMIRPTAGESASLSGEISVRRITPGEERHWADVAAQGTPPPTGLPSTIASGSMPCARAYPPGPVLMVWVSSITSRLPWRRINACAALQ
jgi:hypothetical protein